MPCQKRPAGSLSDEDDVNNNNHNNDSPLQLNLNADQQPQQEQSDSDGSRDDGDNDELITVPIEDIRKELQCPICLGIIRKTRTVMGCLHRFCRECIDKSMRLGNKECPTCRTHCASRRSLRDDPNYDALIAALFPDIDKYEEEEMAVHEEERTHYKQVQDAIAQTQRRQSEALSMKKSSARATAAAFARRSQANRGRRNQGAVEQHGSEEEDSLNGRARGSADGRDEIHPEVNKDCLGASAGLVGNSGIVPWGRAGIRSNPRHGNQNAGNSKIARSNRLARLLESFQDRVAQEALNIHLILVPWDEQSLPSLERLHLRCKPTITIRQICQYVASNTAAKADEIEVLLVQQKGVLCILQGHETLAELQAMYCVSQRDIRFAYRMKLPASRNSV